MVSRCTRCILGRIMAVCCACCKRSPPFFFYRTGGHPDLHSFPTRRSSDLRDGGAADDLLCRHSIPRLAPVLRRRWRSKEHTSELQSPDQLVCRLLLEKNNQRGALPQSPTPPKACGTTARPSSSPNAEKAIL